ncbi:MAG: hypothetical protein AAGJ73_16270 [Pseudomonadota bacterium]
MTDFKNAAAEISDGVNLLHRQTADATSAFLALNNMLKRNVLSSPQQRYVLAAALGVASSCAACACSQAKNAARAGVSRGTMKLALERGVLMAQSPASVIAAEALADFDRATPRRTAVEGNSVPPKTRNSIISRLRRAELAERFREDASLHQESNSDALMSDASALREKLTRNVADTSKSGA